MKLKRKDSYWGLHFDFHAGPDCTEVGKRVTADMIDAIIDAAKPDFIQCDCKGHPGFSSYMTKVGHPAPGFVHDQLRTWRERTAAQDVALYMHYSGVWDAEAVRHHPEWAVVHADGSVDDQITSVVSPYVAELLIPQLKELVDEYGVDGFWIDGECWATRVDYSERMKESYLAETGADKVPLPDDEDYPAYLEHGRRKFKEYVAHYLEVLHSHSPDVQIASNWAFSGSHMPEEVSLDVDYLSGDYTLYNSVNSARFEARYLAKQGKPWDLMAWGFSGRHGEHGHSTKTVVQLSQEAAIVLSQGGGFQCYFTQKRDGSIPLWQTSVFSGLAEFVRARQAYCHKHETKADMALFFSTDDYYRRLPSIYSPGGELQERLRGTLTSIIEAQYTVDLVSEHNFAEHYQAVVIPDCHYLSPATLDRLDRYVRSGGNLLLLGPHTINTLGGIFNLKAETREEKLVWLKVGDRFGVCHGQWADLTSVPGEVLGSMYLENDDIGEAYPSAVLLRHGSGSVIALAHDISYTYMQRQTDVLKHFLEGIFARLVPARTVEVVNMKPDQKAQLDVVVSEKNGTRYVHLVNTAGPHANINILTNDHIPPAKDIKVLVRCDPTAAVRQVIERPGNRILKHEFKDGILSFEVERIDIYSIFEIVT
ncbi:MAG: beta-galactosidase trimerization domain-containing protein [Bacillota bacterium]|nr:beta-galactosidase trimerization domain-containing protein [Bacillota bacterium]